MDADPIFAGPYFAPRDLGCGIGECINQEPHGMCGPIGCNVKGAPAKDFGFIRNRRGLFRDYHVRTQFLSKRGIIHGALTCIVQMTPTRKVGEYVVWLDLQVQEDGHLTLQSARNVYAPPKSGRRFPKGPVNDKTMACIEHSLAGKTLYDPDYVDSSPCEPDEAECSNTPRNRFPKAVLEFEVSVSNNDALDWPTGD